jgi:hypothetical protein
MEPSSICSVAYSDILTPTLAVKREDEATQAGVGVALIWHMTSLQATTNITMHDVGSYGKMTSIVFFFLQHVPLSPCSSMTTALSV